MDRLTAMKMFVRVVETGSFSAVARELNSTQPTISKNIAELESWLGAKLLNRSTRSLRLTETGTDYYERCVAILQDVEEAEHVVGQLQTQPKGQVRVSAVVAFGSQHIVPRLDRFYASYPDIRVDLRLNDRVVDLVEEGVDVAFRMGTLADSSLIARKICSSPVIASAAPAYLKQYGIPSHPRELKDHNYIVHSDTKGRQEAVFQDDGEAFHVRVDGNLSTNSSEAMRAALRAGLGISVMPHWLVGDLLESGELVEILEDFKPSPLEIYAVYPPGRHLPSRVRCLIDFFTQEFRQCPAINGRALPELPLPQAAG
ncbi:MAG: LysR family transcriptional regulator [Pseudomonadales bacterium]|nr:LysR family transcriptional regulator [Pseudomonadales bacterium]